MFLGTTGLLAFASAQQVNVVLFSPCMVGRLGPASARQVNVVLTSYNCRTTCLCFGPIIQWEGGVKLQNEVNSFFIYLCFVEWKNKFRVHDKILENFLFHLTCFSCVLWRFRLYILKGVNTLKNPPLTLYFSDFRIQK